MTISIIVPVFNEEKVLVEQAAYFEQLGRCHDLIFVDGDSHDRSRKIAAEYGKVLSGARGRAAQMNLGARKAVNDILLFLHADNVVSAQAVAAIENAVHRDQAVGGCLTQRIDGSRKIFRLIEAQGNSRARRTKVFYGDQGIFARKDVFINGGEFPDVPVFEDVLFSEKFRVTGKTVVLAEEILVSARRWEKRGVVRTVMMFSVLVAMFKLGFPFDKIKARYDDLR